MMIFIKLLHARSESILISHKFEALSQDPCNFLALNILNYSNNYLIFAEFIVEIL